VRLGRRHAGWSDPTTTDVKGNLLFEDGLSGVEECSIRALRLGPVRQGSCLANASGGLATLDDASTLNVAARSAQFLGHGLRSFIALPQVRHILSCTACP
jgi:hypothetical protein